MDKLTSADLKLESLRRHYSDAEVAGHLLNLALAKSGADSTPASVIDDLIVELIRGLRCLTDGSFVPRLDFSHAVHISKRVYEELEQEWLASEAEEEEEEEGEYCEGCGLETYDCECDPEDYEETEEDRAIRAQSYEDEHAAMQRQLADEEAEWTEPNDPEPEDDYRNKRR